MMQNAFISNIIYKPFLFVNKELQLLYFLKTVYIYGKIYLNFLKGAINKMFSKIDNILNTIDGYVWGIPLIVFILAVGLFLTIRLRGVQFTNLGRAFKYIFHNETDGKNGEVSSFAALCTALSATIGTGNIVGVATAIVAGGPGALFWMWLAALVGTATKYSECLLAVKFRKVDEDGHIVGGPFNYIEYGMGPKWKWLAKLFAFFGVGVGLLGIGTFTQVNGISSAVNNFFDPDNSWTVNILGRTYSWTVVISCLILTLAVALVLIGGLKRISKVAQIVVPFMAATYFIAGILIIIFNITNVPAALATIVQSAFGIKAAAGGGLCALLPVPAEVHVRWLRESRLDKGGERQSLQCVHHGGALPDTRPRRRRKHEAHPHGRRTQRKNIRTQVPLGVHFGHRKGVRRQEQNIGFF